MVSLITFIIAYIYMVLRVYKVVIQLVFTIFLYYSEDKSYPPFT